MFPSWNSRPRAGSLTGWMLSPGSLTAHLQAQGAFRVHRLFTGWEMCTADEAALLGLPRAQRVYTREVCLLVDEVPRVVARSVLGAAGLRRAWRSVRGLGSRPLGAALWASPRVRRGAMSYTCLRGDDAVFRRLRRHVPALPARLPARRSCFYLRGQAVLVMEAFLPAAEALSVGGPRHTARAYAP